MGIRFHCPNGHKIHVKSFLGGQKGKCPTCGVSVQIPLAEEGDDDGGGEIPRAPVAAAPIAPTAPVPTGAAMSPSPAAVAPWSAGAGPMPASPAAPVPVSPVPVSPVPMSPGATGAPAAYGAPLGGGYQPAPAGYGSQPQMNPQFARPYGAPSGYGPVGQPLPTDPFAEAPTAMWYVRPPSGGQFGPAAGDAMRRWLGEGRITPDSLVWREGWSDWKQATAVFPNLGLASRGGPAPGMPPPGGAPTGGMLGGPFDGASAGSRSVPVRRKRNSTTLAVGLVLFLGLAAVALLGGLLYVLSK